LEYALVEGLPSIKYATNVSEQQDPFRCGVLNNLNSISDVVHVAAREKIGPRRRERVPPVRTSANVAGIGIVLAIIFPPANDADFTHIPFG
jgi:hypothetical protein